MHAIKSNAAVSNTQSTEAHYEHIWIVMEGKESES